MVEPHDERVEWELLKGTKSDTCEECGHAISAHTEYGCEIERADAWVTGNQPDQPTVLMAQGPCGCQAWEAIDELQEALQNAYEQGKAHLHKNTA